MSAVSADSRLIVGMLAVRFFSCFLEPEPIQCRKPPAALWPSKGFGILQVDAAVCLDYKCAVILAASTHFRAALS